MTIQEKIMRAREAVRLAIWIQDAQGNECILYPKDIDTKTRWITAYRQRGYTVREEGQCAS